MRKPLACVLTLSAGLTAWMVRAQPQSSEFDAASIKPSTASGTGASFDRRPGMLSAKNATLQDCIREAYGITDPQIVGQSWLKPDRYDILAKMPEGTTQPQRPAMLQALLAARFKLVVHRDNREMPVYNLVVAKNGPKLQPAEGNGGVTSGAGHLTATAVTLARLATFLSGERAQLGHTVLDRTGIQGSFTFTLEWTPDDKPGATPDGPSIMAALQEQLGLKLEASKASVDVLIVDHAEKPTGN